MDILHEEIEKANIKYISFIGDISNQRFDLAIIHSERFYGKLIVINIQSGRTSFIGTDDLEDPSQLEYLYNITGDEAQDLFEYLTGYLS